MSSTTHTVKAVAERYGVKQHTVLTWIRAGELAAVNVAPRPGGKPRWRIPAEAVAAFEAARRPTPPQPRKSRRRQPADVIQFYA